MTDVWSSGQWLWSVGVVTCHVILWRASWSYPPRSVVLIVPRLTSHLLRPCSTSRMLCWQPQLTGPVSVVKLPSRSTSLLYLSRFFGIYFLLSRSLHIRPTFLLVTMQLFPANVYFLLRYFAHKHVVAKVEMCALQIGVGGEIWRGRMDFTPWV